MTEREQIRRLRRSRFEGGKSLRKEKCVLEEVVVDMEVDELLQLTANASAGIGWCHAVNF